MCEILALTAKQTKNSDATVPLGASRILSALVASDAGIRWLPYIRRHNPKVFFKKTKSRRTRLGRSFLGTVGKHSLEYFASDLIGVFIRRALRLGSFALIRGYRLRKLRFLGNHGNAGTHREKTESTNAANFEHTLPICPCRPL